MSPQSPQNTDALCSCGSRSGVPPKPRKRWFVHRGRARVLWAKEEPELPQRSSIYRGGQYRAVYSLRAIQLTGYIPAIIRVGS